MPDTVTTDKIYQYFHNFPSMGIGHNNQNSYPIGDNCFIHKFHGNLTGELELHNIWNVGHIHKESFFSG